MLKHDIVASVKEHDIVRVYSNAIEDDMGYVYYGDIYPTEADLLEVHPDAQVLTGYCIIEKSTGLIPAFCEYDWFDTQKDAMIVAESLSVPNR